jgi:hypothetical protein
LRRNGFSETCSPISTASLLQSADVKALGFSSRLCTEPRAALIHFRLYSSLFSIPPLRFFFSGASFLSHI